MIVKKYLVFGGWDFYPSGGMGDFIGTYDSIDECRIAIDDPDWDWWEIIDSKTMEAVKDRS